MLRRDRRADARGDMEVRRHGHTRTIKAAVAIGVGGALAVVAVAGVLSRNEANTPSALHRRVSNARLASARVAQGASPGDIGARRAALIRWRDVTAEERGRAARGGHDELAADLQRQREAIDRLIGAIDERRVADAQSELDAVLAAVTYIEGQGR